MNKTLLIVRNEILTTFSRKSFLFIAFGLPLIVAVILGVVSLLKEDTGGSSNAPIKSASAPRTSDLRVEGYVDQADLITSLHSDVPKNVLLPYPDQDSAQQALRAGEIGAYYIIPVDYIESGDLLYINPDAQPFSSGEQVWIMHATIFANLLGNDRKLIARAWNPMNVRIQSLDPTQPPGDEENSATFFVPYATMMAFYFVLLASASLLLHSVSEEKKSRVIETLLVSVSPRQVLTGKIFGLGIVGLLQAIIWFGVGFVLLRASGQTLNIPKDVELPFSVLAWEFLFFLLGYTMYASLMTGLGALAPSAREASQSIILVIWPLIVPMFFFVALINDTHGALAMSLSLFPLTAPVAMMTRLAVGGIPLWQPLLAVGLLLATDVFIIRAVSGLFHAQNLLSGQSISLKRMLRAFMGR